MDNIQNIQNPKKRLEGKDIAETYLFYCIKIIKITPANLLKEIIT